MALRGPTFGVVTKVPQCAMCTGPETVIVTLTLTDDTVTAVSVVGDATDATAQGFQSQFASGIAAEVVGVDIDLLDVHRVAGAPCSVDKRLIWHL